MSGELLQPPLDINEASLLEFESTLEIERAQSAAIVAKREVSAAEVLSTGHAPV